MKKPGGWLGTVGDRTTVPGSIFWHNVDGKEYVRELRVENDPLLKTPSIIADEEESEKRDERFDG